MENSTLANRATFPHIACSIHKLPTEFQVTEGIVSQEDWNKIRHSTSECFLPYAVLMGAKRSSIIQQFFFSLAMLLLASTCNSKRFAVRVQEKESRQDWQGWYHKTFSKIYCFIWNTGASERNVLYNGTQSLLEMNSCMKQVVSKGKPAYLNTYIINSTTLNKYIQILRRHDVSYESHLMQFCFPVITQDCERCALQI